MYSSLARTVALTTSRPSSSLLSLRPLVLTSSSIPCRCLSLDSLGGISKPSKSTNSSTARKKHLPAPIADFNYPLPSLSTTNTNHLIRGTDFNTYITPLYHRNWGVRFRGLSGQDQSCLRKTFVFAPSPENVSEGSVELLRFLDEASKLNKSPDQISLLHHSIGGALFTVSLFTRSALDITRKFVRTYYLTGEVKPAPAKPPKPWTRIDGITYQDVSFAYALEDIYTSSLLRTGLQPVSDQRPWVERPSTVNEFVKSMLRQRQVSVAHGHERWVKMKKAKAKREGEAVAKAKAVK